ncbi:MAG: PadR family transcriptional regulator [Pseudomonadota bacterium]
MDVKAVCLGMLSDGEASGYDLKKHFESTFAHFFAAGYGSIYPALSSLAKDGYVDCREVPQEGKPDRKVYRITDAGRERLLEALTKPDPSHKVRSEFLAMMCFAHLMTQEQIDSIVEHRRQDLDRYMKMFAEFEANEPDNWTPGMRFVCGFGKAVATAIRDYLDAHADALTAEDTNNRKAAAG